MDSIKIAILGFGNIGIGVWKILNKNDKKIKKTLGKSIEVKKILVRDIEKNRSVNAPKTKFTTSFDDIVSDPEIRIVIELIGGTDPAFQYIRSCLEHGKHVVTANKAVLATYGSELLDTAKANGVELGYEASVAGGIPIIATLNQGLAANEIEEITGIINGTTNYILTQMTAKGMSLNDALKEAQRLGYAEADPTSDVEGQDASYKLAILTSIAFGIQVSPDNIPTHGIMDVSEKEIKYAGQLGFVVKLLARVKRKDNDLELYVHPALVPADHPLAAVNNEFNALFIRGNAVGDLMLYGRGAGELPTGSAVLSDVMEIIFKMSTGLCSRCDINSNNSNVNIVGEGWGEYYIRLQVADEPGVLGKISTVFGSYDISLFSVVQHGRGEEQVSVVFVTHKVERKQLDRALEEIAEFEFVHEIASILRVEKFKENIKTDIDIT